MQHTVILSSLCKSQKNVVFVVKRYVVRKAKQWRNAVLNAKMRRYAVRKGGGSPFIQCRVWSELNALKRRVNYFDDLQQSHKIPNAVSRKNL